MTGKDPNMKLTDKARIKGCLTLLRYVEDCSTAEIAQLLSVSERTVRRGHREALDRMSRLLHELTGE